MPVKNDELAKQKSSKTVKRSQSIKHKQRNELSKSVKLGRATEGNRRDFDSNLDELNEANDKVF